MSTFLDRIKDLSPKRLALLADQLYTQLETLKASQKQAIGFASARSAIAIVGMSCRFPGGVSNPESYWNLLCSARDPISEVPPERWDVDAFYDPDPSTPGKTYTRWGGFLPEVDRFDADFFGISPREAEQMDPQQRLLLEVSWEAFERAGYAPGQLAGSSTGVYVAIGTADYANLQTRGRDLSGIDTYTGFGTGFCFAPGRLSYKLGLQGPSLALDAACASSLTAVHLACQSLRAGECQMALVGGVNLILSPETNITFSQTRLMAADGRCKTFDAAADGYVRSEGCAAVVLKPLQNAIADGDCILATIDGSATNHGGASGGLSVPNGAAQQAVVRAALQQAEVRPEQVQYVETQGTGTPLGDAIEVRALGAVFQEGRSPEMPLWLASVKTNIGHTETASGLASLIKVVLALQHQALPPHLHFEQLNPEICLDEIPAKIPTTWVQLPPSSDWQCQCAERNRLVFGVNSFGTNGSNAHLILRAAPERALDRPERDRSAHLLPLSAKTPGALHALIERFEEHLSNHSDLDLGDLCFTAAVGRSHFPYRRAWVAESTASLQQQLQLDLASETHREMSAKQPSQLIFTFPEVTASVVGIGGSLYETAPAFRNAVDRCLEILKPPLSGTLSDLLYPAASTAAAGVAPSWLPFVLEYGLAQLWRSWGVEPDGACGEGVGELVAACVAGVLSLEQGLSLLAGTPLEITQTLTPTCPLWCRQTGQMLSAHEVSDWLCQWPEANRWRWGSSKVTPTASPNEDWHCLNLDPHAANWNALLGELCHLYLQGADINWVGVDRGFPRQRLVLPTYPFQRQRYWSALAERGAHTSTIEPKASPERPSFLSRAALSAIDPGQQQARLAADLCHRLAVALGMDDRAIGNASARSAIAADTPLDSLALDSLVALELKFDLEKSLATTIPLISLRQSADPLTLAGQILQDLSDAPTETLPSLAPAPEERYQPFPLNDIQQAYWIGRQGWFEIGNVAAHIYAEIEGEHLECDRLNRAFCQLIERHEMLRAIVLPDGRQQILATVAPYTIEVLDLRGVEPAERDRQLASLRDRLSHQILDPSTWPLFEVRAVRLDEVRTRVYSSIDNLLVDGASLGLLCQEWGQLYRDLDAPLAPLDLSFRDYVLALQAFEQSQVYQRSLLYWQNRLPELPRAPELPERVAPTQLQQPRFTRRTARLSADTWQRLQQYGKQAGLTPSGILVAAYAEVLAMWSKTRRFTLNLTTFNRLPLHPQVQQILGDFTSLTLLAVDYTACESFQERSRQLQQQLWQDLEHSYVSGVRVLRELARISDESAVGAIMPVVFTSLLANPQLKGDSAFSYDWLGKMVYSIAQTPQVWLDHQVYEDGGELVLNWDAVEELFPEGMVEATFAAYIRLLHQLADRPQAWQQHRFALLPEAQQNLQATVNATAAPASEGLLHTLFLEQARIRPRHLALVTDQLRLSYGELRDRAYGVARYLQQQNVGSNQLVAISMTKGWEQVVAALGILMAGAAYLPVDPDLPQERRWHLLERGEVSVVLTQSALEGSLPPGLHVLALDSAHLPPVGDDFALPEPSPRDLAYVIYTSGSTGAPKGVAIEHQGAVNTILDINQRFKVSASDRVFALSSLSFDLSVYDIFGTLAAGGTLVVPPANAGKDPTIWKEMLAREGVTIWNSVPALMQMLATESSDWLCQCAERNRELPSLRLVLLSGDWLPLTLPDQIRSLSPTAEIVSLGGATEASIWSIAYPVGDLNPAWTSIPYGQPLANQRFYVLDEQLEGCPIWVAGELYIGGIGLARDYWRDEEKTAARFIIHPHTGERLYRTGDLGRYLPSGDIEFLGRADDQVKISGHRIELGEIETVLERHPEVNRAVVLAVGEPQQGRQLLAYVLPDLPTLDSEATAFPLQQEEPDGLRRWQTWVEIATAKAQQVEKTGTLGAILAFWQAVEQLYLDAAGVALQRLDIWQDNHVPSGRYSLETLMQRGGIHPRYRRWIQRALEELVRHGDLQQVGDEYALARSLPEQISPERLTRVRGSARTLELGDGAIALLADIAEHLAEILTERQHSAQIYTAEEVPEVYQQQFQTSHAVMAGAIAALVQHWPSEACLRIVEVGAGLGSTTTHLLPLLPAEGTTYLFTDISPYFLQRAEQTYRAYPFLETRLLDLEKPPQTQGYKPHSFDVAIASSVLHATRDIAATLTHLRSLLRPGGVLLLLEETQFQPAFDLTMGLQQGFDRIKDKALRPRHPLLSRQQWQQALEDAGFGEVRRLSAPGTAAEQLGFDVFVARGPSATRSFDPAPLKDYLTQKLPAYMVPQHYVCLDRLPLTGNGKVDRRTLAERTPATAPTARELRSPRNALDQSVLEIWQTLLKQEAISIDDNFFDLGGDSLVATQAIARVREAFQVDVPLRTLFENPTVAALADAIAEALAAEIDGTLLAEIEADATSHQTESRPSLTTDGGATRG